ncbi:MAG: protein jag, partial [Clostridia bacterium]|nr:protein jag [Clostridia bacterium]
MSKIFTGKTVDEATAAGLEELGIKESEAEVLVLDQGSKGFLGFGAKPAKVQLIVKTKKEPTIEPEQAEAAPVEKRAEAAPKERKQFKPKGEKKPLKEVVAPEEEQYVKPENPTEDAVKAEKFLVGLLKILGVEATVELLAENSEKAVYNIVTEDSSSAIGYRGEVLDSLQTLVGAVYNTEKEKYLRVVVDCEGYRAKRQKTLVSLAKKLATKAVATGRKVTLEPMNPYERRIIHSALIDYEGVKTVSEGKEPNRFVAIIPDGYDPMKAKRSGGRFGGKAKGGARPPRG